MRHPLAHPRSAVAALVLGLAVSLAAAASPAATTGPSSDATTVTAHWPAATTVRHHAAVVVTGTVTGGPRPVHLEHRTLSRRWETLARTTTTAGGRYRLRIPTSWYAAHTLRIHVPPYGDMGPATAAEGKTLTVAPGYRPLGTARRHAVVRMRFDPCETVEYRVNPARMPKGGLAEVKRAIALTAQATGLRFRFVGASQQVPIVGGSRRGVDRADLLIGWATAQQIPRLRGGVIGLGGPAALASEQDANGYWRTTDAWVALDSTWKAEGGFGSGPTRGELLLHEIGHAVGLLHVDDRRQLMFPTLWGHDHDRFEAGDLGGLHRVGRTAGCFADADPAAPRVLSPAAPAPLP